MVNICLYIKNYTDSRLLKEHVLPLQKKENMRFEKEINELSKKIEK